MPNLLQGPWLIITKGLNNLLKLSTLHKLGVSGLGTWGRGFVFFNILEKEFTDSEIYSLKRLVVKTRGQSAGQDCFRTMTLGRSQSVTSSERMEPQMKRVL